MVSRDIPQVECRQASPPWLLVEPRIVDLVESATKDQGDLLGMVKAQPLNPHRRLRLFVRGVRTGQLVAL